MPNPRLATLRGFFGALLFCTLVALSPGVLAAQLRTAAGVGVHSEGGWSDPGVHLLLSSTTDRVPGPLDLRGEVLGMLSRNRLAVLGEFRDVARQRRAVGVGLGVELASDAGRLGPYGYLSPTWSFFDDNYGQHSAWQAELAGGIGMRSAADSPVPWAAELSWRGHGGFPFDTLALGALTVSLPI